MNNKPDNGWQEKLDDLIDSDYWSYPEDTRSMIFTTKKIKSFISSLLEQTREEAYSNGKKDGLRMVLECKPEERKQKEINWKCPNCGRYGEEGEYCPSDRRKLVEEVSEYPNEQDESYNQAIFDWSEAISLSSIQLLKNNKRR